MFKEKIKIWQPLCGEKLGNRSDTGTVEHHGVIYMRIRGD